MREKDICIGKSYYDSMIQIMLNIADRLNHKNQVFTSVIKYSTTPNIINVKTNRFAKFK